jgi:putative aminopeptidase FrvX
MRLLETLCAIHAPSGDEGAMTHFILDYVRANSNQWTVQPKVIAGGHFHENIILVFGEQPRTAIFAHLDSIGFTVRYDNKVVKVGGPVTEDGIRLCGVDSKGAFECILRVEQEGGDLSIDAERPVERGTHLTFVPDFRETEDSVQCCYMDNRLGVWSALQVAETLTEGIIVFSTREEHGGGAVAFLGRHIFETYGVSRALISDITWITEGVNAGDGVVISMRDRGLPRRTFLDEVIGLARESGIPFQLEVEGSGGSDGLELQASAYPWEWVFVGAAEDNVHSPDELVHKSDIDAMVSMYQYLMKRL